MAASQGQAIRPLLGLLRHLCCLVLQHGEALQLPVLAICQLWRREAVVSTRVAVTTINWSDSRDQMRILMTITPQRENGLWALCCPAPGSCVNSSNLLNSPGRLYPAHYSEGTTEAQRGQHAQGHTAGGRAEPGFPLVRATRPCASASWGRCLGFRSTLCSAWRGGAGGRSRSSGVRPDCTPQAEDATAAAGQGTQSDGETDGH